MMVASDRRTWFGLQGLWLRWRPADTATNKSPDSPNDTRVAIEAALGREILISERQRATILAAVFGLVVLIFGVSLIFLPDGSPLVPRGIRPVVIGIGIIVVLYTVLLRGEITRRLRAGRKPPGALRYIGVTIETSIPTITIIVSAAIIGPMLGLLGPPPWFYFLFIILSALRLSFWPSAFTGAVAAVEYVALSFYYLGDLAMASLPGDLLTPGPFLLRGLVLLTAGLVAGFVSSRIRDQMLSLFHSVEER